jgi:hypothetical protein
MVMLWKVVLGSTWESVFEIVIDTMVLHVATLLISSAYGMSPRHRYPMSRGRGRRALHHYRRLNPKIRLPLQVLYLPERRRQIRNPDHLPFVLSHFQSKHFRNLAA